MIRSLLIFGMPMALIYSMIISKKTNRIVDLKQLHASR